MRFSISKKKEWVWLILLLLAALAFRLYHLNYEGLWNDELFTADTANPQQGIADIVHLMKYDVHPPLYNFIANLWCQIFPYNDTSLRIFSVLLGLLAALSTFQLAKLLFNKKVAFYTLLFVVVNSYLIRYSQEVRSYSFLMTLTNYSFFYFVKITREAPNRRNWLGYIAFTAALLYTHYYGLFVYAGQGIMLLFLVPFKTIKAHLKQYALGFALPLLLFSAWIPILIRQLKVPHGSWRDTPSLNMVLTYFEEFFNDGILSNIVLLLFLVTALLLAFKKTLSEKKSFKSFYTHQRALWLLCGWTVFYFCFPMLKSASSNSILLVRYFIGVVPPVLILIGFFISLIPQKGIRILLLIVVLSYSVSLLFLKDRPYYTRTTSYREIVAEAKQTNPEAYVLYIGKYLRYFEYYIQQNDIQNCSGYLDPFRELLKLDAPDEYFLFLDLKLIPEEFKKGVPVVPGYHQVSEKIFQNQHKVKTVKLVRYQKDKSTL